MYIIEPQYDHFRRPTAGRRERSCIIDTNGPGTIYGPKDPWAAQTQTLICLLSVFTCMCVRFRKCSPSNYFNISVLSRTRSCDTFTMVIAFVCGRAQVINMCQYLLRRNETSFWTRAQSREMQQMVSWGSCWLTISEFNVLEKLLYIIEIHYN